jgi:hypothetical protein
VKKLFVILIVMGFLAVTLSMGAVGCKTEKTSSAPAATTTKG